MLTTDFQGFDGCTSAIDYMHIVYPLTQ